MLLEIIFEIVNHTRIDENINLSHYIVLAAVSVAEAIVVVVVVVLVIVEARI